jgi:membrane associated rhomboid family serine protease
MRRYPSPYASSISFGPGPLSTAIKALILANVAVFVVQQVVDVDAILGLGPEQVVTGLRVWQLGTYMFLHANPIHLLFNMLALWMFGTELERIWGTRGFLKFYFVIGVGAAVLTVLFSLLPITTAQDLYAAIVIGASGAIYGLLLAYALYFPDRPILLFMMFPIPAKYFVMIVGALAFYSSIGELGGVANATHLGGLIVGYLYLKGARIHPVAEMKYHYLKWKINRTRRKFDVYSGGRSNDWDRRVH